MPITFADLFAGIGGFRLGIENASKKLGIHVECVFSSEIEKNARFIYEKNFHTIPHGDITKIQATDIPRMDILCGGFPCQAFSIAGKRRGFDDTRGTLFFEIARIARDKRPKILFLENVKGLLNHDSGRTFGQILITLDELGYDCEWQLCNSKDFGVPQNRERVFIIGHLRGERTRQVFPVTGTTTATTRENSSTCLDANYFKGIDNHGARTGIMVSACMTPERLNKRANGRRVKNPEEPMFTLTAQDRHGVMLEYVGSVGSNKWLDNGKELSRNYPQGNRVYSANGIATTLSSQAGGLGGKTGLYQVEQNKYIDITTFKSDEIEFQNDNLILLKDGRRFWRETLDDGTLGKWIEGTYQLIRKLTPTECERLQSFPDSWTEGIADTNRYRCLGNAVTVNVIEAIAEKLLKGMIQNA